MGKTRKTITPRIVAYHEAGHAVIHRLFAHKITEVSITPDEGSAGRVNTKRDKKYLEGLNSYSASLEKTQEEIVAAFAGQIAEDLSRKWNAKSPSIREMSKFSSMGDYRGAEELAKCALRALGTPFSADQEDKFLIWLYSRTRDILRWGWGGAVWKAVQKVAKELLKKKSLSPKEIETLFQKAFTETLEKRRQKTSRK
jgi:hypothetical protein